MTFGTGALATGQTVALPLMFETQKVLAEGYQKLDTSEHRPSLADSLLRVTPLTKSQEKLKIKHYINMRQEQTKATGNVMQKIKQYAASGADLHMLADFRKST